MSISGKLSKRLVSERSWRKLDFVLNPGTEIVLFLLETSTHYLNLTTSTRVWLRTFMKLMTIRMRSSLLSRSTSACSTWSSYPLTILKFPCFSTQMRWRRQHGSLWMHSETRCFIRNTHMCPDIELEIQVSLMLLTAWSTLRLFIHFIDITLWGRV